jgi:hypothetical protein
MVFYAGRWLSRLAIGPGVYLRQFRLSTQQFKFVSRTKETVHFA